MCNANSHTVEPDDGELENGSSDSDVSMTSSDSESNEQASNDIASSDEDEDNEDDEEEEDAVVTAIKRAREKVSEKPPEVFCEDMIIDISFHPNDDVIAAATLTGDVLIYSYSVEKTELLKTLEVHTKSCRAIEFSSDGNTIITGSKDKSIMFTDVETTKLKMFFDEAHEDPLYCLMEVDEHLIASGDENGYVKLWDLRQNKEVLSLKEMDDYVSAIVTTDEKRFLACTSGEGTVTSIDIRNKRMHIQSELYEAELTCAGLVRKDTKLVVGSSQGSLLFYNWGQFGLHTDELPRQGKKAISCMIPISENVIVTGWEDGIIRATYLFPNRNLGIVGQHKHGFSVESLDISHDGQFVASCSLDQKLRFWPISYFEDVNTLVSSHKKNKDHNLPSSNFSDRKDFFADLA